MSTLSRSTSSNLLAFTTWALESSTRCNRPSSRVENFSRLTCVSWMSMRMDVPVLSWGAMGGICETDSPAIVVSLRRRCAQSMLPAMTIRKKKGVTARVSCSREERR